MAVQFCVARDALSRASEFSEKAEFLLSFTKGMFNISEPQMPDSGLWEEFWQRCGLRENISSHCPFGGGGVEGVCGCVGGGSTESSEP